jgi:uncharacterized OB-fold protein
VSTDSSAVVGLSLAKGALASDADGPVLIGGRCRQCGTSMFPAQPVCPSCMQEAVEQEPLPRAGVLYAFSKVHVGPAKWHKPFTVGYVDLDNGVRVFSHLTGAPAVGQRMQLDVGEVGRDPDGTALLTFVFKPAE